MIYRYTSKDLDLLGRLIRAEAVGEGRDGMLKVGNVVSNRIKAYCFVFHNLKSLNDVIFEPNAFAAINSPLFTSRATTKEKELARKALRGYKAWPAYNALWFYSPRINEECRPTWFEQPFAGRYKNHCFYRPIQGECDGFG